MAGKIVLVCLYNKFCITPVVKFCYVSKIRRRLIIIRSHCVRCVVQSQFRFVCEAILRVYNGMCLRSLASILAKCSAIVTRVLTSIFVQCHCNSLALLNMFFYRSYYNKIKIIITYFFVLSLVYYLCRLLFDFILTSVCSSIGCIP